jgi:L-lactate dehydrogenase complex protein LldF
MELTANKFKANASKALIDVQLQKALGNVERGFIEKRAEGVADAAGIRRSSGQRP